MYLKTVEFKREKDSEWEKGFYIGRREYERKDMCVYLDQNYQPIERGLNGFQIWDYRYDTERRLTLEVPLRGELIPDEITTTCGSNLKF